MTVRSEIVEQFTQVALEQDMQLAPLTDNLELLESGLDSLCFAVVPFSVSEDARFPVTFGEFVKFYEEATR